MHKEEAVSGMRMHAVFAFPNLCSDLHHRMSGSGTMMMIESAFVF
jgi:hypothetical protein